MATATTAKCPRCERELPESKLVYGGGQCWRCCQATGLVDDADAEVANATEDVAGLLEQLREARAALRKAERRRARMVARYGENV